MHELMETLHTQATDKLTSTLQGFVPWDVSTAVPVNTDSGTHPSAAANTS